MRARRQALGLTQEALAHRAQVAHNTVALVERGVRGPSEDTARALAEVLGLAVEDLYDEDGAA
jgi:transcriptional regulator with XRE-family HTH domain